MQVASSTSTGRATRARILDSAARLISERGVAATSLGDVRDQAGVSQSQLYHHFGSKHGLVEAVVDQTADSVLAAQLAALGRVETWADLEGWMAEIVAGVQSREGRGGCPIGTLAAATADTDDALRGLLDQALGQWREGIRGALARLRDHGALSADADLDELATATLASLQGGLLLAKTARDAKPLALSLDATIALLKSHAG
jgi:AcrR family transcriptional regulator